MAHKHNRRRVRRSRNPAVAGPINRHSLDQFIILQPGMATEPGSPDASKSVRSATVTLHPTQDAPTARHRSDIPARLWQNRYAAWQDRDRAQQERAAKLEAQQIQLFGGEPGDDVELCYRMLEYFGGLDYIF